MILRFLFYYQRTTIDAENIFDKIIFVFFINDYWKK